MILIIIKPLINHLKDLKAIVEISARIDLINKDIIFELKCISQDFNVTHYL